MRATVRWWALALALLLLVGTTVPVRAQDAGTDYRLGVGDIIRVNVFQSPELTMDARIGDGGVISYPLLGTVKLGGLTASQAEQQIAQRLRSGDFLKQPNVSIVIMQFKAHQAAVLGHVNRPGRYPLDQAELRLSDLMAMAGGATQLGADVVAITGVRNGAKFALQLDLPEVLGGRRPDPLIQNGDVIYVDKMPMVYIYGEVQRPGGFRLERGMTVMQALATGGGLTQRGTEKGMRIHRRSGEGKTLVVQPNLDDQLADGDVIYVRESLF